ncbi:MAG: 50S ribosomal protein L18 [Clostridia bacterium]|jgi:large subunit ribosomal protein L18|nr:50S ribosomal protein L18 [Clostridia bacterium]
MIKRVPRSKNRMKKHMKVRNKITGTAERPRLSVFKSNAHIYAQIIDDVARTTIVAASTMEKEINAKLENTSNKEAAALVGEMVAKKAVEKGIEEVVFDRGGYVYHGKVEALANAARENGLKF